MESVEGKGTKVTVNLPVDRAVLESEPNILFIDPEELPEVEPEVLEQLKADSKISENLGRQGPILFPGVLSPKEMAQSVTNEDKKTILIVEDHKDIRLYLKVLFGNEYNLLMATNGQEGVDMAMKELPDLIICDVLMPGLSGFEVTGKLKSDFNTSHIPIILLTALNAPESHLEGVESGADAYITKPFSTKLLLARVFKLIEQRDKLREKFSSDLSMIRPVICTTDKDKEFTDKLTRIVEEQLDNPDFTVDDFASMMSLGRTIFYRKVRGVTGYTPKEYLRIMRMKKAAELLSTKKYTVSEVTYMVGINDPFYFSRCFKAQFGISPSSYQKRYQEGIRETEINED